MTKAEFLALFGGSVSRAAEALDLTHSAVSQWPDGDLSDSAQRRVDAWRWRQSQRRKRVPGMSAARKSTKGKTAQENQ